MYCLVKLYVLKQDIYVVVLVQNPVFGENNKWDFPFSSVFSCLDYTFFFILFSNHNSIDFIFKLTSLAKF